MGEKKAVGNIFNIGTSEEITIEELAKRVKAKTRSKSKLEYVKYEDAYEEGFEDMRRRVPDLTKIEKLIGYKPRYSFDDILDKVIEYFEK